MKKLFLVLALLTTPAAAQNLTGYQQVFYENFSNLSISNSLTYDGSRWFTGTKPCCMTTTDGTGNLLYPSWPPGGNWGFASPFTISPSGGLDILLSKQIGNTAPCNSAPCWVGGQINSVSSDGKGNAWQYGYFEAKIKLPAGTPGLWPSISFYSLPGGANIEIDELEAYSQWPAAVTASVHNYATSLDNMLMNSGQNGPVVFDGNWHVWGMLWTASNITMYLDGVAYAAVVTPPEAKQPLYLSITNGLGGAGGQNPTTATPPSHMQIQYVRVMQKLP